MISDFPALPAPIARLLRDISLMLDAGGEAQNNVRRGEAAFLRANLRSCSVLARQIQRRASGKRIQRLVARLEKRNP